MCPCFDLPESFDLLMRRLSHHGRQREKGKLRKARKDFRVELHAVDSAAELHAVFPTLVDMHRSSRALHGESSPFTDHAYAAFHREVIETLLPDGLAKLYLLTFDDKPAAFLYGYVFNGKYYAFQVGFDSGMGNYSPGAWCSNWSSRILSARVWESSISFAARSLTRMPSPPGNVARKRRWCVGARPPRTPPNGFSRASFRPCGAGQNSGWYDSRLRYDVGTKINAKLEIG